jgi:hypothetical protein
MQAQDGARHARSAAAVSTALYSSVVQRPDWAQWQRLYESPERVVAQRLRIVQRLIRSFLASHTGQVSVVSLCAGQGRDLLDVLADHPDRTAVRGRLIELDLANSAEAARRVRQLGLDHMEVVTGDAALTDAYLGAVPADLVLVCGVFGNIPDHDVRQTVATLPQFCAQGATVIWTRHRKPPDLTPAIRSWFAEAGFVELGFESTAAEAPRPGAFPAQSVGAHRWPHAPVQLVPGQRLFTFLW